MTEPGKPEEDGRAGPAAFADEALPAAIAAKFTRINLQHSGADRRKSLKHCRENAWLAPGNFNPESSG